MGATMDTNIDPRHVRHGVTPPVAGAGTPYVSPYGAMAGLAERIAALSKRLRQPGYGNFVGLGPCADLEVVMRLLNLREFIDHLNVNGDDEQRRWAAEMLAALDEVDEADSLYEDIDRVLPVKPGDFYGEAVEVAAKKAVVYDAMRAVLEQVGAIDSDDTTTDLPALIRALLQ
jgi:hypothetical protein